MAVIKWGPGGDWKGHLKRAAGRPQAARGCASPGAEVQLRRFLFLSVSPASPHQREPARQPGPLLTAAKATLTAAPSLTPAPSLAVSARHRITLRPSDPQPPPPFHGPNPRQPAGGLRRRPAPLEVVGPLCAAGVGGGVACVGGALGRVAGGVLRPGRAGLVEDRAPAGPGGARLGGELQPRLLRVLDPLPPPANPVKIASQQIDSCAAAGESGAR